jgi:dTMP kinase
LNDESSQLRRGFLFVLEGIDGSGKSSACVKLKLILESEGYDVVHLREPTNESIWGKEIRARSPRGELSPFEELELFIRDREWHVQNRILPALNSGKLVLLDRYFFATGAYQSEATGLLWQEILKRNREEIHAPEPDLVFILDVDAEVGLARATGRENRANLQFERLERLVKVRAAYLEIAEHDSGKFRIIDAEKSLDAVVQEVHREIIQTIKLRNNQSQE